MMCYLSVILVNWNAGAEVLLADLSRAPLDEASARRADLVAFHLPMHTATRLATRVIPEVRGLNPRAHLAAFGLYAPLNEAHLRALPAAGGPSVGARRRDPRRSATVLPFTPAERKSCWVRPCALTRRTSTSTSDSAVQPMLRGPK